MAEQTVFLSVKNGGKGVPYGYSDERPNGSKNYGFKALKSNPEELGTIPEAQGFSSLTNALVALNHPSSPFFTVGCEKAFGRNESGFWANGYLEFSFNYSELASDAQFYFKLFFEFNKWYWTQRQEPAVRYNFELEPAHFLKANIDGFTVSVWIAAGIFPNEKLARCKWESALDALVMFLKQQTVPPNCPYTALY